MLQYLQRHYPLNIKKTEFYFYNTCIVLCKPRKTSTISEKIILTITKESRSGFKHCNFFHACYKNVIFRHANHYR